MARKKSLPPKNEHNPLFFSTENESLFQMLFKHSADALQLVDPEGRVLYSSDSVERVIGYSPEEIQGVIVAPYIHPDDVQMFGKIWTKLLKRPGSTTTLEYRVRHKNGEYVNVETTLTNHLETEPIHAIVGNFRDISESKKMTERLSTQIKLLSTITENATLGLVMMDDQQRCNFMNPAAEKILGYSFRDISKMDKTLHDIIHYAYPNGSRYRIEDCPIDKAFPTKMQTRGEDMFIHADGSFYPVAYVASPITEHNKTVGTIIQLEDISNRKAIEAEHRRLTKIEDQRNELLRLNRSKDEFIALASHQLRTPATAVKQYAGMLLDGLLGPLATTQSSMLQKAYDANEREITIIDDLLRIARLDAGKIVLKKRIIDIVPLIEKIIAELNTRAQQKEITIRLKIESQDHKVYADEQLVRTVVENLLDNAIKYSYESSAIEVSVSRRKNVDYFTIADQGVGIKKSERHKLFERFVRLPNALSISSGGTGLGLYWALKVISMHGGDIKIRSNKPTGTKFIVSLPSIEKM